jgi:hypothetical protein
MTHKHLQSGKDENSIRRLVNTNWIRTIAWSMKAVAVTIAFVELDMLTSAQL